MNKKDKSVETEIFNFFNVLKMQKNITHPSGSINFQLAKTESA